MPPPDPDPATATCRSSQPQLHNFSFPILKKWGTQRVLRCLRVNRKGDFLNGTLRSIPSESQIQDPDPGDDDQGLDDKDVQVPVPVPEASSSAVEVIPWSLRGRKRRASCGATIVEQQVSLSPLAERACRTRAVRLRPEQGERPRFSITLTREEIAEDIYAVTGALPRRRPRKRAPAIQRQLDFLLPGLWLTEIRVDSYKVPE